MATLEIRDWAHLPPELLEIIAARLTHLPDLIRFSSVCAPWRSSFKSTTPNLPPQLPWLLLPKETAAAAAPAAAPRRFFSLSENRTYALPLPESRRTRTNKIFPSPSGRIVTPQGIQTLALLNPLTRFSIPPLPPLPLTESRRKNIGVYVLRKAKLFGSDLVAALFPDGRDILFCRLGEASWKRIDTSFCLPNSDFAYCDGKFFAINCTQETVWVFDVDTLQKVAEIPLVPGAKVCDYLVESPSGELLLVRRRAGDERKRFLLFRLEISEEEGKWIEVRSMGDIVLFVDGLQAMVFAANDFKGWRRNCVYFVDYLPGPKHKGLMVFDIREGRIEQAPLFSFTSRGYWGRAMWIVPTLF